MNLYLASQSPRRKQILEMAEIPFQVLTNVSDESFPTHYTPSQAVEHIAANKAKSAFELLETQENAFVLSADTVVVCQQEIIGKPKNREEAIETLQRLSGIVHHVITGVCIHSKKRRVLFHETTEVQFLELSLEQITHYVDHYQPYDKAGAYAIQEWIGLIGIESITGDFYNVMGLPIHKVYAALIELGL